MEDKSGHTSMPYAYLHCLSSLSISVLFSVSSFLPPSSFLPNSSYYNKGAKKEGRTGVPEGRLIRISKRRCLWGKPSCQEMVPLPPSVHMPHTGNHLCAAFSEDRCVEAIHERCVHSHSDSAGIPSGYQRFGLSLDTMGLSYLILPPAL